LGFVVVCVILVVVVAFFVVGLVFVVVAICIRSDCLDLASANRKPKSVCHCE
jgi:hypothetical protein